ncbi:MAG: GAF domain-containing protein [Pseudanabaenaceae cyanobacterium]|jgi:transcriptional regulator with GAF, ATPase, and Fis domain
MNHSSPSHFIRSNPELHVRNQVLSSANSSPEIMDNPQPTALNHHEEEAVAHRAIEIYTDMLRSSIGYAQSVSGMLILKTTLKNILSTLVKESQAQQGSIFLIDEDGNITESILARGATTKEQKLSAITKVLDDGLAGWALRQRHVGWIHDTMKDDRWVQLPNQPYTVRSAVALPIIYGIEAIGIVTMMHNQPDYFTHKHVALLEMLVEPIAAIIINSQIHAGYNLLDLNLE